MLELRQHPRCLSLAFRSLHERLEIDWVYYLGCLKVVTESFDCLMVVTSQALQLRSPVAKYH